MMAGDSQDKSQSCMELRSLRHVPWGASFWGLTTIVLLVASMVFGNQHLAILAMAPAMLTLGLLIGRRREFRGLLTDEALCSENPPLTLPYAEIEGLTINGVGYDPDTPKLKGHLMVIHRQGVLEIPKLQNVPSHKLYRAILTMLPTTGNPKLSSSFAEHVAKESALFGHDRVHVFGRRKVLGRRPSTRRSQLCAALLLFCGIGWCLIFAFADPDERRNYEPWVAWGFVLSLLSTLAWLIQYLRQIPLVGNARSLKNAELVISPTGLAVQQGDLQGHLRWAELLDVRCHGRTPIFVMSRAELPKGVIHLVVAGAAVQLADVYDRPIALIHRLILRYWKRDQTPEAAAVATGQSA